MFLNPSLTFYLKIFNSPKTGIGALRPAVLLTICFFKRKTIIQTHHKKKWEDKLSSDLDYVVYSYPY